MEPFTLSRDQVRELDRRAAAEFGVPGIVLMENAGRGCAELLMRLNPEKKPVVILCGPGNNGGDGFVIARHLDIHGWPVRGWTFAGLRGNKRSGRVEPDTTDDSLHHYRQLRYGQLFVIVPERFKVDFANGQPLWDTLNIKCWVVDALFGTGLTRPLGPPFDEISAIVNASRNPVLAIDLPSGLDCDTGEPLGPTIRATHTATFVAPKKGFLNPKSREWTGEIHVIDIGAPRVLIDQYRGLPRRE